MTVLDRISTRMTSLANRRVLLVSGALVAAIAAVMFATTGRFSLAAIADQCGQPAPDVRWATSVDGVHEFLVSCGDHGRSAYRDLQLLDLVYPAALGFFLASALAFLLPRALRGRAPTVVALAALPLLGAACDYLENVGAWIVLGRYPDSSSWAASLFTVASPAKQAFNWISSLLLVFGLVGAAVVRLRARRADTDELPVPVS